MNTLAVLSFSGFVLTIIIIIVIALIITVKQQDKRIKTLEKEHYRRIREEDKQGYEKLTKAFDKQMKEYKSKFPKGDKA
ncbi:MAG: hypothetical protein RBT65_14425 [Methanolobus sp.]|nr:hypothetical protein [Methanolobus sp.]